MTNSNLTTYRDIIEQAGLNSAELNGLNQADIDELTPEDLLIANSERIRIQQSDLNSEVKEKALKALDPLEVKSLLATRNQLFEDLKLELQSAIKFKSSDSMHQAVLSSILSVCQEDPEFLSGFVELAKACGTNDALGAIFNLSKIKDIYLGKIDVFKKYVAVGVSSVGNSSNAIKTLYEARSIYGNDLKVFMQIADVAFLAGSSTSEVIKVISVFKDYWIGSPEKINELASDILRLLSKRDKDTLKYLMNFENLYRSDIEIFKGFLQIAEIGGVDGIKALSNAERIYVDNLGVFKRFVEAGQSAFNFTSSKQSVSVSINSLINIIRPYASSDVSDTVVEVCLSIAINIPINGLNFLFDLKLLFGNDADKFIEVANIILNQRYSISELLSVQGIFGRSAAMFVAFIRFIENNNYSLEDTLLIKLLISTKSLYEEDVEKFKEISFTIAKYYNDFDKDKSDIFIPIKKVLDFQQIYGKSLEMAKGFLSIAFKGGVKAVSELVKAKSEYEGNIEKFRGFVTVGTSAGEKSHIAISTLYTARNVYGADIDKFYICVECIKSNMNAGNIFLTLYVKKVLAVGRDKAIQYFDELHARSKVLIGSEVPPVDVREDDEYLYMVSYVYPKGDYSNYKINLRCGDKIEHLDGYKFNSSGYQVELSGLLGYRLADEKKDNTELFDQYSERIDNLSHLEGSRDQNQDTLKEDYSKKVDKFFDEMVAEEFKNFSGLTIELKILLILLNNLLMPPSSALSINQIIDLVLEYRFTFKADLADFIKNRSTEVEKYTDPTSKRYIQWNSLTNIYGESLLHTWRNDILEKIKQCKAYPEIIKKFREKISREDQCEFSPKQKERIESILANKHIKQDVKCDVLKKQLRIITINNISFGNIETEQEFNTKFEAIISPLQITITQSVLDSVLNELIKLRTTYLFNLSAKIEEILRRDINLIFVEVAKFEEIIELESKKIESLDDQEDQEDEEEQENEEVDGKKKNKLVKKSNKTRRYTTYFTKTAESANARMGAHLCIAGDESMWDNPDYFEAVMHDQDTYKCVGLTMFLNITATDGKRYLWFGPNPSESLLSKVSSLQCFNHQYELAVQFAIDNAYDGVVVPSDDDSILGYCTNRGGDYPDLIKSKRLRTENGDLKIVDFGKCVSLSQYNDYEDGALIWER